MNRFVPPLLILVVSATSTPVLAQAALAPGGNESVAAAEARSLFEQGAAYLQVRDYDAAVRSLIRSAALQPRAATFCNLAIAQERRGNTSDAITAYRACAEIDESGRYREHAQERMRILNESLPREPTPPVETHDAAPAPAPVQLLPSVMHIPEHPRPGARRAPDPTWLVIGSGTAVLGVSALIAGIVFGADATGGMNKLRAAYPDGLIPAEVGGRANPDVDALRRARSQADASDVLIVAGIAATALGAIIVTADLLGRSGSDGESPTLRAHVGPGSISMELVF